MLASSGKKRAGQRLLKGYAKLDPARAGELQGWPEIVRVLQEEADHGPKGYRLIGARLMVHYLGNGVPRAMGEWIAWHVLAATRPDRRPGRPRPVPPGGNFSLELNAAPTAA